MCFTPLFLVLSMNSFMITPSGPSGAFLSFFVSFTFASSLTLDLTFTFDFTLTVAEGLVGVFFFGLVTIP